MKSDILNKAPQRTRKFLPHAKPSCAIILGSGWGDITKALNPVKSISYSKIPGLGNPGVAGHAGQLLLAEFAGMQILVFQGRRHWYEGCGWEPVAIPVHISLQLGVSIMILTNAAGGVGRNMKPGTLMIIDDHINAIGSNPLIGNTDSTWGPMFADQTRVYDPALRKLIVAAARKRNIPVKHGVYAATSGPTYETPTEIICLRRMGADAVGMSTIPEAILANAAGMRVAGLSCITNTAAHTGHVPLSHHDVIRIAARTQPAIKELITGFLREVAVNVFNLPNHA